MQHIYGLVVTGNMVTMLESTGLENNWVDCYMKSRILPFLIDRQPTAFYLAPFVLAGGR